MLFRRSLLQCLMSGRRAVFGVALAVLVPSLTCAQDAPPVPAAEAGGADSERTASPAGQPQSPGTRRPGGDAASRPAPPNQAPMPGNAAPMPQAGTPAFPQTSSPLSPFSSLQPQAGQRPFLARSFRTPDIFGDTFIPVTVAVGHSNTFEPNPLSSQSHVDVPLGGGIRRFKNEHARALPTDRVFFLYNHFHNALQIETFGASSSDHVDQFTLGFERTFDEGNWSFEMRMPMAPQASDSAGGLSYRADGVGNLTMVLKRLMYADEELAAAVGMAVGAPTGSDVTVNVAGFGRYELSNDAVHLLPFATLQFTPTENWFFHTYAQVDVAANSNEVSFYGAGGNQHTRLADQTFLFLDASAGYWWYKSDDDDGLTGLASVIETHYSTTLNDADSGTLGGSFVGSLDNRIDVVNLTAGLHTEWNRNTALRAAVVVPVNSDREKRFFDSEFQLSLIMRLR